MATKEYEKTPNKLYEHTNKGLDILHKYLLKIFQAVTSIILLMWLWS